MKKLFQLPDWMVSGSKMFRLIQRLYAEVWSLMEQASNEATASLDKGSITVMREIVEHSSLPPEELEMKRLKQDVSDSPDRRHIARRAVPNSCCEPYAYFIQGIVFVNAGMETTARTIAVTFYHILNNPHVLQRLQKEMSPVLSSSSSPPPPLSALEKLPYLTAVINEGHRMAHGVAGRLARVAPDEDLVCHGYKIPRGVTMSQSNYLLHRNPEAFPDPLTFRPERFLQEGIEGVSGLEALRNLVPFSRGARMCVGMNLAWAELYLTVAVILKSVRMELVDTTDRDVTVIQEHFIGMFPDDSKGIRVRVVGKA